MKYFYSTQKGWKGEEVTYAVGYDRIDRSKLVLSFARCSANDTFIKSKARAICAGRMAKGKFAEVVQQEGHGLYETLLNAIKDYEHQVEANYGH